MTGNYIIYDVVWCGYVKRQDNKKIKDILYIITGRENDLILSWLQLITFIGAQRLNFLSLMDKVGFTCFPERITRIFKFFNRRPRLILQKSDHCKRKFLL